MEEDKQVFWHDVPFSHKVAFPSTNSTSDSGVGGFGEGGILVIFWMMSDSLEETDSWMSRKLLRTFSTCSGSLSKLVFSPTSFFLQTNKSHTHYLQSCKVIVTECVIGGTDSGGVHQSTLLLVKHSPLPHHLTFLHLLQNRERIESCSHVLQHNIIWPNQRK